MPDEEKMDDDFSAVDDAGGARRKGGLFGFIPSIVIQILKWVFILLALISIMVIVSWLVNRTMNSGQSLGNELGYYRSPDSSVKPPMLDWFDQLEEIRTRTADSKPAMIIIKVSIGYTKEDQETLAELIDRQIRLHDSIRYYFSQKKQNDLKNEEMVKQELKDRLNQIMNTERIKDISFKVFDIIDM